jgi:hypothetical protein
LLLTVGLGCSNSAAPPAPATADDAPVREQFKVLQATIKEGDPDRIWPLLTDRSQADAERIARDVRTAYSQAGAEDRAAREKALGLSAAELAELTGQIYLKSKRFRKRYGELPESKIEQIQMQGDHATVRFLEPDGDKEKAIFVRQDGQWKVWLKIPKPE